MVTIEDCIALCDTSEDVVRALAEHEGLDLVLAAGRAQTLASDVPGRERLRDLLAAKVGAARADGDACGERYWQEALASFVTVHPHLASADTSRDPIATLRSIPRPIYQEAMLFSMRLWFGNSVIAQDVDEGLAA